MNLTDLKKKREKFLLTVYELAEGNANRDILTDDLTKAVGVDAEEIRKLSQYWRDEGMVRWTSFERIHLTPLGRSKAEGFIESNEQKPRCPDCGQENGHSAKFCEHCGTSLSRFNADTLVQSDDA